MSWFRARVHHVVDGRIQVIDVRTGGNRWDPDQPSTRRHACLVELIGDDETLIIPLRSCELRQLHSGQPIAYLQIFSALLHASRGTGDYEGGPVLELRPNSDDLYWSLAQNAAVSNDGRVPRSRWASGLRAALQAAGPRRMSLLLEGLTASRGPQGARLTHRQLLEAGTPAFRWAPDDSVPGVTRYVLGAGYTARRDSGWDWEDETKLLGLDARKGDLTNQAGSEPLRFREEPVFLPEELVDAVEQKHQSPWQLKLSVSNLRHRMVRETWNDHVAEPCRISVGVGGGHPASFVPKLVDSVNDTPWKLELLAELDEYRDISDDLDWEPRIHARHVVPERDFASSFELGVRDVAGTVFIRNVTVRAPPVREADDDERKHAYRELFWDRAVGSRLRTLNNTTPPIRFAAAEPATASAVQTLWVAELGLEARTLLSGECSGRVAHHRGQPHPVLECRLDLALGPIALGQAVRLENKAGAAPALTMFVKRPATQEARLEIEERVCRSKDSLAAHPKTGRTLSLRLESPSAASETPLPELCVTLSTEPFLVVACPFPALASSDESLSVGVYDHGEGVWRLRTSSPEYEVRFPPQGIGEAILKGMAPQTWEPTGNRIPVRFSPPASLRLRPSDLEEAYPFTPYNLERLFGAVSGDIGSYLVGADIELLYGLRTEIKRNDLRVAELLATRGHAPAAPSETPRAKLTASVETDAYAALRGDFIEFSERLAKRPAIIELLRTPPSGLLPQGDLHLDTGVSFHVRTTAKLKPPVSSLPAGDPWHQRGLPGGWAYGFEVARFAQQVVEQVHSDGGEIARPALSALGGFGDLRAPFDNGNTAILASVEMGRVHRYAVERFGRIGVLHHRAKHVILYERTVERARQFETEQNAHDRKPLIRKVAEYVELLQPERRYDGVDRPGDLLLAGHFKTRRILVKASWGFEVMGLDGKPRGWAIPLWKRGVPGYPFPDVFFELATDPDGGSPSTERALEDPEKLHFYSEYPPPGGKTDPNTDAWPPAPGIDFPIAADPSRSTSVPPRNRPPREVPYPKGFEAFTFTIAADATPLNVVAGKKTERAISASIRTLTLTRARLVARTNDAKATTLLELPRELEKAVEAAVAHANPAQALSQALGTLQTRFQTELLRLPDAASIEGSIKRCWAESRDRFHSIEAQRLVVVRVAAEELRRRILADASRFLADADEYRKKLADEVTGHALEVYASLRFPEPPWLGFVQALRELSEHVEGFRAALHRERDWLLRLAPTADAVLRDHLASVVDRVAADLEHVSSDLASRMGLHLHGAGTWIKTLVADFVQETRARIPQADVARIREWFQAREAELAPLATFVAERLTELPPEARALPQTVEGARSWLEARVTELVAGDYQNDIRRVESAANSFANRVVESCADALKGPLSEVHAAINSLSAIPRMLPVPVAFAQLATDARVLAHLARLAQGDVAGIELFSRQLGERLERTSRFLANELTNHIEVELSNVVRLPRIFGRPPRVPGIDFHGAEWVSYFPGVLADRVLMTPIWSQVQQGGRALQAFGLDFPIDALTDRLVPHLDLPKLDLREVLRQLGGLKLLDLPGLRGLLFPQLDERGLRVHHGIDPQSRRAWVEVDVLIEHLDEITLLDAGFVKLTAARPRLSANARVEASGEGQHAKVTGRLEADLKLAVSGATMITAESSAIHSDGDELSFDIKPRSVKLAGVLEALGEAVRAFVGEESGLRVGVCKRPDVTGLEATLDLPIPDVTVGAFGLAGLRLGAEVYAGFRHGNFSLGVFMAIGRPTSPFLVTIFVLSGGGWLEVGIELNGPGGTGIVPSVDLGISAGATLGIALGPIRGVVYAYVSFRGRTPNILEYSLTIGGEVSLLGFITVSIRIRLALAYAIGGGLTATGTVELKIKICWCFTLRVRHEIRWELGKGAGKRAFGILAEPKPAREVYKAAARQLLATLE